MNRFWKTMVVLVLLALYVGGAYLALFLLSIMQWMFVFRRCDDHCGSSDTPFFWMMGVEGVLFLIFAVQGVRWIMRPPKATAD